MKSVESSIGKFGARSAALLLLIQALHAGAQQPPGENRPPPLPLAAEPAPPAPSQPAAAAAAPALSFQISAFVFKGNTRFDDATLAPLVADYLNRPVTVADLNAAADRITSWYVHHGYSLALAVIPVQTIDAGQVRIEVLEGRIGYLRVDSHMYKPERLQRALLPLERGSIYRASDMEAGLLRLNSRPGLHARALLRPGAEIGDTNVLVQTEEKRFGALASVDDYGRDSLGKTRLTLEAEINDPLRISDHAQLQAVRSTTGGLFYGYFGYDAALWSDALRGRASYGQANYKLSGLLEGFKGKSRNGAAGIEWAALRNRRHQLTLSLGASRVLSNTTFEGLPLPFDERYTLFELGLAFAAATPGSLAAQTNLSIGSSLKHPKTAAPDAVKLRVELDTQLRYELVSRWDLYARLGGAWAPDALPVSAQYTLGGPYSVRGFPVGDRRGDSGYLTTLGLRRSFGTRVHWDLRGFADAGGVYNKQPQAGKKSESLISAGLGADAAVLTGPVQFSLQLDVAQPVGSARPSDGKNGPQVFAQIVASY